MTVDEHNAIKTIKTKNMPNLLKKLSKENKI